VTKMNEDEAFDVVLSRLRLGASRVDAQMELMAGGFARDESFAIVARAAVVVEEERQRQSRLRGNLKMCFGGSLLLIALATSVRIFSASPGSVYLPVGLLAIGGYLFLTGMSRT